MGLAVAAGAAKAQPARPDVTVAVHPAHFAWAGQAFEDLDALQAVVGPRTPQVVGLLVCAPAAVRPTMAAAYRFRHLHLDLQAAVPGDPRCAPAEGSGRLFGGRAAAPPGPVPDAAEKDAAARWWRQLQP
jgi:hypothetical protein